MKRRLKKFEEGIPGGVSFAKREVRDEKISKRFKKRRGEKKDTVGARVKKDRGKREGRFYPVGLSEKES